MEDDFFGFSPFPGPMHNGHTKPMERDRTDHRSHDHRSHDDIDSRNDETFGDAALVGPAADDWEEEHEKMAVLLELEDPHLLPSDLGTAPGRKYKTQQEEALEESISQLVVDDDDYGDDDNDDEDSVTATLHSTTAGRPIPGRKHIVDLDELLGPTSPPSLLNTEELIGGHHSIWGSPHTREMKQKHLQQQEDSLQNLLRAMHEQHIQESTTPQVLTSSSPAAMLSSVLPNALTLEEIEKEIIGGSTDRGGVDRILAPEELFRHVTVSDQASSPSQGVGLPSQGVGLPSQGVGLPMPIGTPPRSQIRRQVPPTGMPSLLGHQSGGLTGRGDGLVTNESLVTTSTSPEQLMEQLYAMSSIGAAKLRQAGMQLSPTTHPLLNPSSPTPHDHLTPQDGLYPMPSTLEGFPSQRAISPATQKLLRSFFEAAVTSQTEATGSIQPNIQLLDGRTDPMPTQNAVQPRMHLVGSGAPTGHPVRVGGTSTPCDMSRVGTPPSGSSPQMGRPDRMTGPVHNLKTPLQGAPPWRPPCDGGVMPPFRGMMGRGGPHQPLLPYPNGHPMYQRPCGPPPFPDPGHMRFQQGRFMAPPPGIRQNMFFPNQYGPRPPMFMGHRGGPPPPHHMHGPHPMHGGGPHMGMPPRYPPPPHHHPQGWGEWEEEGEREVPEEEYAGLMLQREKDWVIKIQLLQLQTDNPYLDDFYYTTWLMKKAAEERKLNQGAPAQNKSSEPKLVLPHLARIETKNYKPVQFENSLGRLTSSNVHSPRQIIDVHDDGPNQKEAVKGHELRRLKQILLDIEKNYDLLLEVDDLEKRVLALPDHARQKLFDDRRAIINELFSRLHCHSNKDSQFVHMICIKKGLRLVGRFIPLLDQSDAQTVMAALLRHLTVISRKDWQAKVLVSLFESMHRTVSMADLETLVTFTEELCAPTTVTASERQTDCQQTLVTALQNKFGSSVIWSLINRGEVIYTQVSPVGLHTDHQVAWRRFVGAVVEAIEGVDAGVLAQPQGHFTHALQHVERLITNQQSLAAVEEKLAKVLACPQQT